MVGGFEYTFFQVADSDADIGVLSFFIEAERRIGDSWKIEAEARLFGNVGDENVLAPFKRDSFVNFRLLKFF